jgi:hypothetical protein
MMVPSRCRLPPHPMRMTPMTNDNEMMIRSQPATFALADDERTMEFPFSSEYPVSRYFGNEVLEP